MKKEEHLIEALLVYSNEVYQQIVAGIEPLNITDNNEREILATSLFLKVLEMSYAIMHLARSGPHSALPPLFRSLLEASVDLTILSQSPDHYFNLVKKAIDQEKKILNARKNQPTNRYLSLAYSDDRLRERNTFLSRLSSQLPTDMKDMRIEDKFKKAGMEDVYDGVYRFISNETHNMITLLRGRQLDLNADVPFIRGFRKWSYKELLPFVDAVVATLYSSSVNLLTALSRPLPSELEKVPEKIKIFRDAALDAPQR